MSCFSCFACVVVCALVVRAAPASQPVQADMGTVRQRMIRSILPVDAATQTQIKEEAALSAAGMNAAGTWDDIDFTDKQRTRWKPIQHTSRLLLMCRAYRLERDGGQPDPKLLDKTNRALDYWLKHDYQNPNWWHNEIGTPQLIGQSVLLLQPEVSQEQLDKSIAILRRSAWEKWTGQNLVWGVTNQIVRGLIQNDAPAIAQAFDRMYEEIRVTTKEGIQPDQSFHQHGDQFYSGGYGLAFAQDVPRFVSYSWGTRWQIPAGKVAILNAYLLDGEQWMMHGARFDHSARGREVARKGKAVAQLSTGGPISPVGTAYGLFNSLSLLAQQPVPRQDELTQFALRVSGKIDPPLVGNRQFWCSDYMAHHRPGWFSSVRMFSTRMINTEIVNDEGKKSHHLADGCNLLYVNGDEYFDIFPVWDWLKIPGTTAEQTFDVEDEGRLHGIGIRGKTSFVGGVSDGSVGLAAMQLQRGKLTARKAWFMFDDGYLCLGAGITCTGENHVVTTINQCNLAGPVEQSENCVRHAGVGYLFAPGQVTLTTDEQVGSWSDIGVDSGPPIRQKVFKLWIDHGVQPSDATYAYVVMPTASFEQTTALSRKWPVKVVSNTPSLQAAVHDAAKALACVFAEAGRVEYDGQTISVDQPCLLLMRDGKVTLANPNNKPLTVNVRVNQRMIRVDLPDGPLAGSSVSVPVGG